MKITKYVQELRRLSDNVKFIKPILRPLTKIYFKYIDKNELNRLNNLRNAFKQHGLETLDLFDKTMKSNGYKYSLAFGTLLGAVREKGFIGHDLDIDVFVWYNDFDEKLLMCLKDVGFRLTHTFLVDNGISAREDTIEKDGVQIDIFYIYPPLENSKFPYCCDFVPKENCRTREQSITKYGGLLPRRFEMPISEKVINTSFENIKLPILSNAHEFLSFRYGKDYMIPNPSWTNGHNPHIIAWEEKIASYFEF